MWCDLVLVEGIREPSDEAMTGRVLVGLVNLYCEKNDSNDTWHFALYWSSNSPGSVRDRWIWSLPTMNGLPEETLTISKYSIKQYPSHMGIHAVRSCLVQRLT